MIMIVKTPASQMRSPATAEEEEDRRFGVFFNFKV